MSMQAVTPKRAMRSVSVDPKRGPQKSVDAVAIAGPRTGPELWWYFVQSAGDISCVPPTPLTRGTTGGTVDHEPNELQAIAVRRARGVEAVLGMLSSPEPSILGAAFRPLPPGLPREWVSAFGDLSLLIQWLPSSVMADIAAALRPKTPNEMLIIDVRLRAVGMLKDACRDYSLMRSVMRGRR